MRLLFVAGKCLLSERSLYTLESRESAVYYLTDYY
jgi:hypothetical protein